MRQIFGALEYVARSDATVLITGETGTGKDVLARSIWQKSRRNEGPFVVVDCGALSPTLIESELFGHERGAFTGAVAARQGAFASAAKGTVFLDEVGELPLDLQPKLLRVLERKEYKRVGGNKTLTADVRVIAATKRHLPREVEAGRFREDLYFRLAVVPVEVPPLRERREDIPMLVTHLLGTMRPGMTVPEDAMAALVAHDWPGNVRELRNVIERGALLEDQTLRVPALAPHKATESIRFDPAKGYHAMRAEFDRRWAAWLLARHGGDRAAAAHAAGLRPEDIATLLQGG
jgi:transcriptional regulator with GAF, ATPase, and Fis domain